MVGLKLWTDLMALALAMLSLVFLKKNNKKKNNKKNIILVHQTQSLAVSDASRTSVDKVEKEFKVAIGSLWKN